MARGRAEPNLAEGGRRGLPVQLTSFVGRHAERGALAAAVCEHRLVTATGPGGVGKTRLAIVVAEDVRDEFADGVVFIDLVQVTDPTALVGAIADAAGVPERAGSLRAEALVTALRDQDLLIVLDNCEHLADAARRAVAALMTSCPGVHVLATSRMRLLLPGEKVVPVPGMSIGNEEMPGIADIGDAVALFVTRARESGADDATLDDPAAVRDICRTLDGMALAIELGAARVPSIGLDGLRLGLESSLDVLALDNGSDSRHRSLRAAIEWTYRLLDERQQRVLLQCSVFGVPFDLDAAAAVCDAQPSAVLESLGQLVDWNLVSRRAGKPTRFRILETIRQYVIDGGERSGHFDGVRERHARWVAGQLAVLRAIEGTSDTWVADVDRVADEARTALAWLARSEAAAEQTSRLATLLAEVEFLRGRPSESQQRFQQAADSTAEPLVARANLVHAARAALARYVGGDAVVLMEKASGVAESAGHAGEAGEDLATAVLVYRRHVGTVDFRRSDDEIEDTLLRAAELGDGIPIVEATIAVARAAGGLANATVPLGVDMAVDLARSTGDALLLDAALDIRCGAEMVVGDVPAAARTVEERLARMDLVPIDVRSGMDHADVHLMAAHVDLARGHLAAARRHADDLAALPFLREESHVALARRMEVDSLAGWFDDAVAVGDRFERGWREAGCPKVQSHAPATYALSMVHGILGDEDRRFEWQEITRSLVFDIRTWEPPRVVFPATFDALVALHRGDADAAMRHLKVSPDDPVIRTGYLHGLWLPLYAAAWAEASLMVGAPDMDERLRLAAGVAEHHEMALAMVQRTEAVRQRESARLLGIAEQLLALGAPYQHRRTLEFAGVTTPPSSSERTLFDLTARELEVLELVVIGRTNPQIAAQLYISRKTAEHHVSRILTKMGATTRAEAAAAAARAGLGSA